MYCVTYKIIPHFLPRSMTVCMYALKHCVYVNMQSYTCIRNYNHKFGRHAQVWTLCLIDRKYASRNAQESKCWSICECSCPLKVLNFVISYSVLDQHDVGSNTSRSSGGSIYDSKPECPPLAFND